MCIHVGSSCDSLSLPDVHVHVYISFVHTATFTWLHRYTSKINVVLQMCQYMYTTWDHGLALSGHQGSFLSLKRGLHVSASLNSLHTAPLKTGRGHSTCGRSPEARPRSWGFAKEVELLKRLGSAYTQGYTVAVLGNQICCSGFA